MEGERETKKQPTDTTAKDPFKEFSERLEIWRQSKLDKFDVDEEYRDARLLKHGTRTGFEEFLDRAIEKRVKEQIATLAAKMQAKAATKKSKTAKSGKEYETEENSEHFTKPFDKALNAFEKMAKALKEGKGGLSRETTSKNGTGEAQSTISEEDAGVLWKKALSRMDSTTKSMWEQLQKDSKKTDEMKRRFLLSLQSGVPAMFRGRIKGSALTFEDQDNILHGMIRAAFDEQKGTGDGLDDGETNVLKKFQTDAEQAALAEELAAREKAEKEEAAKTAEIARECGTANSTRKDSDN